MRSTSHPPVKLTQIPLQPTLWLAVLGLLLPLMGFGWLAEDVWSHQSLAWDNGLLLAIHSHASATLDRWMVGVSLIGGAKGMFLLVAGVLGYLAWQRRWIQAVFFAVATAGAEAMNLGLKAIFHRARPDLWLSPTPEHDYSFPSGHAMGVVAVIAALVVLAWPTRWRWWVLGLGTLFALTVSFSRLYLGVHFPSDVLAGWGVSLAWVTALLLVFGTRGHHLLSRKP